MYDLVTISLHTSVCHTLLGGASVCTYACLLMYTCFCLCGVPRLIIVKSVKYLSKVCGFSKKCVLVSLRYIVDNENFKVHTCSLIHSCNRCVSLLFIIIMMRQLCIMVHMIFTESVCTYISQCL